MAGKILCVFATKTESDILKSVNNLTIQSDHYLFRNFELIPLITGVGSIATAWSLKQWFSANETPVLALNMGIAGSFNDDLTIGEVVIPVSDCFADAGIEDNENFLTLAEAGLASPDHFPFESGKIFCRNRYVDIALKNSKGVKAITVNTATGSDITRKRLIGKFNPDIESMEGATFFYICAREKVPFLALRSISNRVEARNSGKWNIPGALKSLSEKADEFFTKLD